MDTLNTKIIFIDFKLDIRNQLIKAKKLLQEGQIVAFPTETVYGLGVDALNPDAIKLVYAVKGRPIDNPLILHCSDLNMVKSIIANNYLSKNAEILLKCFSPGPITIILFKNSLIPDETTSGLKTVAVRIPDNEIARNLISMINRPIAAPSANLSGKPSPTTALDVLEDMNGKIPLIIDGGATNIGLESTVIDMTKEQPTILRPGKISIKEINECIPKIIVNYSKNSSLKSQPLSPGLKYRHYAPKAELLLFNKVEIIDEKLETLKERDIGIMISIETFKSKITNKLLFKEVYTYNNINELASSLFATFREMDRKKIDIILFEEIPDNDMGIGFAIMNRVRKALKK